MHSRADTSDSAAPKTALIVDDEAHVRTFVRMLLKQVGITTCWEAANGAEALAMAKEHRPHLVMLDINLPLMKGLEVLEQLTCDVPESAVVIVSSESAMKTVLEAARLGAVGYILKHSAPTDAVRALREALERLDEEVQA